MAPQSASAFPYSPDVRYQIGQAVREMLRLAPTVHAELADLLRIGTRDLLALDHVTSSPEPLGVVELADRLGVRSASATVLVDRLVDTGHLERGPHASDRRRTSLHPTASAHRGVAQALDPLIRDVTAITGDLDEPTAEAVLTFLRRVTAALQDFSGNPSRVRSRS